MNCRDVSRLSTSYIDGELDDGRASALRGHLRTCDDCRARLEDEAALVDAADELAPVDPPPALWANIETRLAEAEIADAGRSRLWLWWQAARERALPVAVGVTCAAAVVLWLSQRGGDAGEATVAVSPPVLAEVEADSPPAPVLLLDEARRAELARAEARYVDVIADLRALVDGALTAEQQQRLAELDREALAQRNRLAASGSLDPFDHDALYAVYRAEISLLRDLTMGAVLQ